jgi:hypothetical protein
MTSIVVWLIFSAWGYCAMVGIRELSHRWYLGHLQRTNLFVACIRQGDHGRWKYFFSQDELTTYNREQHEKRRNA